MHGTAFGDAFKRAGWIVETTELHTFVTQVLRDTKLDEVQTLRRLEREARAKPEFVIEAFRHYIKTLKADMNGAIFADVKPAIELEAGQDNVAQGRNKAARSQPLSADHERSVQSDHLLSVRREPNEQGQASTAEGPPHACPAQPSNGRDHVEVAPAGRNVFVPPITPSGGAEHRRGLSKFFGKKSNVTNIDRSQTGGQISGQRAAWAHGAKSLFETTRLGGVSLSRIHGYELTSYIREGRLAGELLAEIKLTNGEFVDMNKAIPDLLSDASVRKCLARANLPRAA